MERTTRPTVEASNRIPQVLGALSSYLYCEDDDLAEVILACGSSLVMGESGRRNRCLVWWLGQRREWVEKASLNSS